MSMMVWGQTWDGGGDGTSWNDASNWTGDVVPKADSIVVLGGDVTITGMVVSGEEPKKITISSGANIVLDLNLDIVVGTTVEHAIVLNSNASLTFKQGRTYNLQSSGTKNVISFFNSSTNASIIVEQGATLNLSGGTKGILQKPTSCTFTNNGTVNITGVQDGMQIEGGNFYNNGLLSIDGVTKKGIWLKGSANFTNNSSGSINISNLQDGMQLDGGTFTNNGVINMPSGISKRGIKCSISFTNVATGSITITEPGIDCVELKGGNFMNHGTMTLIVENGGANGDNALYVDATSSFTNTSNNSLNASGGGTGSKLIDVQAGGMLDNTGTITVDGGSINNRFSVAGVLTNSLGGTIDVKDGRINNSGTFTNDGLIKSASASPTVNTTGTSYNNGFYDNGGTAGNFSSGSGTKIDIGIDINDPTRTNIDMMGGTTVDLAEAPYEWLENGSSVGTADVMGFLSIPAMSLSSDPAILTNANFSNVKVTISNFASSLLPIELVKFELKLRNEMVLVEWETTTEINNDYFVIEHSTDGHFFREIARIRSAGIESEHQSYSYLDESPNQGKNYYRLKQFDLDGKMEVFPMKGIKVLSKEKNIVYPTLLENGDFVTIDLSTWDKTITTIRMSDKYGKVAHLEQVKGGRILSIPVGNFSPGLYFLVLQSDRKVYTTAITVF